MSKPPAKLPKRILDKDLDKLANVEEAAGHAGRQLVAPGLALLFLVIAATFAAAMLGAPGATPIAAAAAVAAYMALNIGANDVANNVGPAVGARVIRMGGALAMAAVCEVAGALIAGGRVVETIAAGIVLPGEIEDAATLARLMVAALMAAALWIHLSTFIRAPVSTTHAIVGGVVGGGVAAAGLSAVNWPSMAAITASWVLSPVLAGLVAAAFLAMVEATVFYRDDKLAAARHWVPLFNAAMGGAFAAYLADVAAPAGAPLAGGTLAWLGAAAAAVVFAASRLAVGRQARGLENRTQSLRVLFTPPLIAAAGLLSFAHGANDVANAVGPLAAIVEASEAGQLGAETAVPFWVMLIGGLGISVGLLLFGPRLIRIVGSEITKLNPVRAFCIALSTAVTVLLATWLGLPVSTTHIAVGSVFGVGFYREWASVRSIRRRSYLQRRRAAAGLAADTALAAIDWKPPPADPRLGGKKGSDQERLRRRLVRRAHVTTIVTAWVTTVPVSAVLAALTYALLSML